ncbi:alpha/beta fold hydrolase [Bacillus sp. B15-48]|nr:alpha/beta fold hydrolase [Bacillus sp. B15-48]MBM4765228.1 alpha/beta fold hydrolase [Bacillus sp. B15-48]
MKRSNLPVGLTPKKAIWKKNKATLWYYPAPKKKYKTPLFLIYSLINQAYILDLSPDSSMIKGYIERGYDVYLLDFGVPGYEDQHINLEDYIVDYIQTGARRTLRHSRADELTVVGYCLGGTLAVIYAALATEPIKNLILFAAPIDFTHVPYVENWQEALKTGDLKLDELIDEYGVVPAKAMKLMFRMLTAPINSSQYLALFTRRKDKKFVEKWQRFNQWAKGHVPFAGAALKDLLNELLIENKLINNNLVINKQKVNLQEITANLLVVSTEGDQLISESMIKPLMSKVASNDKTYKRVKGGHVSLAIKGGIPDFLADWLKERS